MIRFVILISLYLFIAPVYTYQPIDPALDLTLLWEQVHEQPEDFALACMPLTNRAGTVLYNPAERFPLASVSKLLIFIEYARRVDEGTILLGEMVDVQTLNNYDIVRTDRGAHDDFMDRYGSGVRSISLWEVASDGMMQYSSNAASDYLLARMDPIDWDALYQSLFITNTSYPHPLGMIPLLMNNHELGQSTLENVQLRLGVDGLRFFERYVHDPQWRESEINYRLSFRRSFPEWSVQSAMLQQQTATGTVYDFIGVMSAIYGSGGALSDNVKQMVRDALRWEGYRAIDATYFEYGSKLGFYSGGTLTLVAYGYPIDGAPVVSAAFFRNVSRHAYYELLRSDSIGDLAHWLNLNGCSGVMDAIGRTG